MPITRRRLLTAAGSAALAPAIARAAADPPVMSSTVVDWTALTGRSTEFGLVRQVFKAPTATLVELECHVSTLNPGLSSHAPHRHPNEEMIIVQQGTVEVFSEGKKTRVGPGSVIFHASNHLHGLTNVGDTPATYHVINWRSSTTPDAAK
jgi:mannose-6-phosphate isomerase-like protein (cupin superfamily)